MYPLEIKKCEIQPTLLNLHLNEYSQELHYYPLAVKLNRCVGSCNTLNELSNKVSVSNKTEDLNMDLFNIITRKNENKRIYEANVNLNLMEEYVIQIKSGITTNVDASVKNMIYVKRLYLVSCYM